MNDFDLNLKLDGKWIYLTDSSRNHQFYNNILNIMAHTCILEAEAEGLSCAGGQLTLYIKPQPQLYDLSTYTNTNILHENRILTFLMSPLAGSLQTWTG